MDTTRTTQRRRWTDNPHQIVPPELAAGLHILSRVRGGGIGALLASCRDVGWGVPALAVAAGMKPDAVAQQILRARRAGAVVDVTMHLPRPQVPAEQHPAAGFSQPNPVLPELAAAHLRDLHTQARLVRFNLPADHPYRAASEHLAEDIAVLLRSGYRKLRITAALGVSYRAVDQLLERHGHRPPAPSVARRRAIINARKVA